MFQWTGAFVGGQDILTNSESEVLISYHINDFGFWVVLLLSESIKKFKFLASKVCDSINKPPLRYGHIVN